MKKTIVFTLLIAALLVGVGSSHGCDEALAGAAAPTTEEAVTEEAVTEEAVTEEAATEVEQTRLPIYGMQMWVDEETGALRAPTADEAAYMSELVQRMFTTKAKVAPRVLKHEGGMESIALDESFLEFSVARIGADGQLEQDCVDNADQALEYIEAATPNNEEQ